MSLFLPAPVFAAAIALVWALVPSTQEQIEPVAQDPVELSRREKNIAQTLSPLPALPKVPSNRFADDPAAARLGQRFFYDPRLSRDGDRSCASCHSPGLGWSDGLALSEGLAVLNRNSPSLLHAGLPTMDVLGWPFRFALVASAVAARTP